MFVCTSNNHKVLLLTIANAASFLFMEAEYSLYDFIS